MDYWVTSFDFANPYDRAVDVWLYGQASAGEKLITDLDGSSAWSHKFTIPSSGTYTLASSNAAQALKMGWMDAYASLPVQGIATYTRIRNGVPIAKVTAEAAQRTVEYLNIANRNLGLAIANPQNFPISVTVLVRDQNGNFAGSDAVNLPPWGHTAFNLYGRFPSLPQDFRGTVHVGTDASTTWFLAWSLTDDGSGVSSALPAGNFRRPVNQRDRIQNVFYSLLDAFDNQVGGAIPELEFIDDVSMGPNAYVRPQPGAVEEGGVTQALGELLADSADELAAVIAHELGHVAQFREGGTVYDSNPERDADIRGTILVLEARYDPYALAGALSKLSMASGQAGLVTQWEAYTSGEIHGSFNDRLSTVYRRSATSVRCQAWPVFAMTTGRSIIRIFRRPRWSAEEREPHRAVRARAVPHLLRSTLRCCWTGQRKSNCHSGREPGGGCGSRAVSFTRFCSKAGLQIPSAGSLGPFGSLVAPLRVSWTFGEQRLRQSEGGLPTTATSRSLHGRGWKRKDARSRPLPPRRFSKSRPALSFHSPRGCLISRAKSGFWSGICTGIFSFEIRGIRGRFCGKAVDKPEPSGNDLSKRNGTLPWRGVTPVVRGRALPVPCFGTGRAPRNQRFRMWR